MGRHDAFFEIGDPVAANGRRLDEHLAQHHEENREQKQSRRHPGQEQRQASGLFIHMGTIAKDRICLYPLDRFDTKENALPDGEGVPSL